MTQGPDDESKSPRSGVSGGSPAGLFDFDPDEALLANSAPFRVMPTGRGRPRGSANKRTVKMRELYLRMGLPHPMIWQGQLLAMGIDGLRERLDCSPIEAAELLRKVASDVAPFLESKMPARVEVDGGEGLPVLVMREIERIEAAQGATAAGAMAIDDDLAEAMERNETEQQLRQAARTASHDDASHDEPQGAEAPAKTGGEAAE